MKKIIVGMVFALAIPMVVGASTFQTGNSYSLGKGEVVGSDLYAAGGNVTVAGMVNGDTVVAGGMISVTGSTTQSILAAGGNLTLSGMVGDDIRAAGGNVTVGGTVVNDIVLAGGQLSVAPETSVGGDAVLTGGTIVIQGHIRGKAIVNGGNVTIIGTIDGPVDIQANDITISQTAVLGNGLTYRSPHQATVASGAKINGPVNYTPVVHQSRSNRVLPTLFGFIWLCIGSFIIGLVFRRHSQIVVNQAQTKFWWNLLRGFLFLIVTPIIAIILLITVIGIPFAVILGLLYIISLIVSYFLEPIIIGSFLNIWIFKRPAEEITWQTIFLGAVAVIVLSFIPVLGGLVKFVIMLVALGALYKHGSERFIHRNEM
jgi:hypothetical protein